MNLCSGELHWQLLFLDGLDRHFVDGIRHYVYAWRRQQDDLDGRQGSELDCTAEGGTNSQAWLRNIYSRYSNLMVMNCYMVSKLKVIDV